MIIVPNNERFDKVALMQAHKHRHAGYIFAFRVTRPLLSRLKIVKLTHIRSLALIKRTANGAVVDNYCELQR